MSAPGHPGFDTLSIHAGAGTAAAAPLAAPVPVLEERIAALEGAVAGIATASVQAALHLAIATVAGAGHHVVASNDVAGGTRRLLADALGRFGIETSFVDPRDPDAWRAAIRPATRLLFGETVGGAGLALLDIPRIAAIAHTHDLPLLVDSTSTTPWLIQPCEHGADLVLHAAGGFLGGAGAAGGLLVDGGTFDWQRAFERSGRFGALCEAAQESTVGAFALHARREGLHGFGAAISPHDAAATLQGLETLGLRMERHVANARKVAAFLAGHAAVEHLAWPELDGHPDRALAAGLLPRGCGAVLAFAPRGGPAAARRCVDAFGLFARGGLPGGARSVALDPAAGARDGSIRLSIGLETADDLVDDLGRALKLSQKGV